MLGVGKESQVALCADLDDPSTRMAVGLLVFLYHSISMFTFLFRVITI